MRKRKYLWVLYIVLFLIVLGIGICVFILGKQEQTTATADDLEQLKNQLKVYVPVETESEPEPVIEPESVPESVNPPETEVLEEQQESAAVQESEVIETEEITESEEIIETEETITETEPETIISIESEGEESEVLPQSTPETNMTIDFERIWEVNPDVHAWIEIAGTKVDYPVLQSATDDNKYLTTALEGSYYIGGSLFTQATYNNKDFNDPVTVVYGHTMRSGTLFGQLQEIYTSQSKFKEYSEITLYLPDEVRKYTVFAAVPYSNAHILATYDFSKKYWFNNFIDGISDIREFGAQFNRDIEPEYGDRILILSTCLNEDSTRRFLVMAIYQGDI